MKAGDRVLWQYTHAANSSTYFDRVKEGTFIRKIRNPVWVREANQRGMGFPIWCLVHFDGNKNPSRVMLREIVKVKSDGLTT